MTLNKNEINKVIAEAAGWQDLRIDFDSGHYWLIGVPPDKPINENTYQICDLNPCDSISDAMEAVEVLCGDMYSIEITKITSGEYEAIIWPNREVRIKEVYRDTAPTWPAAISLALEKYIKEKL